MDVRPILIALAFAGLCAGANAAPPKQDTSTSAPETIDVDAMARAKDAGAATTTPESAPATASDDSIDRAGDTPAEAAPAPVSPAAPAADSATPAAPLMATPPVDATEKRVAESCNSRAKALLDAAQKGDFAGATQGFDAKMRTAMTPAKLKAAWDSLAQFGNLQARGESHPGKGEGYYVVMVPLIFDKANLVAQVACGSDGLVAGFYIKPLEAVQ